MQGIILLATHRSSTDLLARTMTTNTKEIGRGLSYYTVPVRGVKRPLAIGLQTTCPETTAIHHWSLGAWRVHLCRRTCSNLPFLSRAISLKTSKNSIYAFVLIFVLFSIRRILIIYFYIVHRELLSYYILELRMVVTILYISEYATRDMPLVR